MATEIIPGFEAQRAQLSADAPAGWILGFNYSLSGPESMFVGYPDSWRREYEEGNYAVGDPVLLWAMLRNRAFTRWSEIAMPDLRNVMVKAKKHGIHYGAVFTRRIGPKKSFLTMARSDREFTDVELATYDARFNFWVDALMNRATLTDAELDVLRAFRDGLGHTETAALLGLSESAIKLRLTKACTKLGAANRTQAVAVAVSRNYI